MDTEATPAVGYSLKEEVTSRNTLVEAKESSELVAVLRESGDTIKMAHEFVTLLENKLKPLRASLPQKDEAETSRPWEPIHDTTAGSVIRDNDAIIRYLIDRIITLTQETRI
jgi:hypothetical protein